MMFENQTTVQGLSRHTLYATHQFRGRILAGNFEIIAFSQVYNTMFLDVIDFVEESVNEELKRLAPGG